MEFSSKIFTITILIALALVISTSSKSVKEVKPENGSSQNCFIKIIIISFITLSVKSIQRLYCKFKISLYFYYENFILLFEPHNRYQYLVCRSLFISYCLGFLNFIRLIQLKNINRNIFFKEYPCPPGVSIVNCFVAPCQFSKCDKHPNAVCM